MESSLLTPNIAVPPTPTSRMKRLVIAVVVVAAMLFVSQSALGQQNAPKPDSNAQTKPVHSTHSGPSHGPRTTAANSNRRTKTRDKKTPKQTVTRMMGKPGPAHTSTNRGSQTTASAKQQAKQKLLRDMRDHRPSLPGTPKRQDGGKCSVPVVGKWMDKSPYMGRKVCGPHDKTYRDNKGTAWSWFRTVWRTTTGQKAKDPVDQANRDAAKGVWNGAKKHAEDIRKKTVTQ